MISSAEYRKLKEGQDDLKNLLIQIGVRQEQIMKILLGNPKVKGDEGLIGSIKNIEKQREQVFEQIIFN